MGLFTFTRLLNFKLITNYYLEISAQIREKSTRILEEILTGSPLRRAGSFCIMYNIPVLDHPIRLTLHYVLQCPICFKRNLISVRESCERITGKHHEEAHRRRFSAFSNNV